MDTTWKIEIISIDKSRFENIQHYVWSDDQDWEGKVEYEPDLHRLDCRGAGQAGGHREVDRGQDHHAGDVDGDHQVHLTLRPHIVGHLVDNKC